MGVVLFDTLRFAKRLEEAGVPPEQAEAIAEAQKDALDDALQLSLATKDDISRLRDEMLALREEVRLVRWMVGFTLAFCMAILWRVFAS